MATLFGITCLTTILVVISYNGANCQLSWFGNQNSAASGSNNTGTGNGMPNWLQMADQFMTSWMNNMNTRQNSSDASQSGGFFENLMSGITSFSNEMIARRQNSTLTVPPRVQRMQNRTREWFNNWMNNSG